MLAESLDVVYYTAPVPSSWQVLATLALVFDRIHFPGVYMGTEGLDEAETLREIQRIRSMLPERMRIEDLQMLNCMLVASQHRHIKEFCVFPGAFGYCGTLEPGAEKLMMELEQLYFGPPSPGFHPTPIAGFAKGLPGSREAGINGPSWLSYPANAFVYAGRHGLPYINDDPRMPMLGPPEVVAKNDPKLLSTILAVECVRLALPSVKPLETAEQVQELRERTRDSVQPFRRAMVKFTKDMNAAIGSESSMDEVVAAAEFVVKTEVEPALDELRRKLADPSRSWTQRFLDLVGPATALITSTAPLPARIALLLAGLIGPLRAEAQAQRTKAEVRRSGLSFLLRLQGK